MKTTRIPTLFFSLFCSAAIPSITFSTEQEPPATTKNYLQINSLEAIQPAKLLLTAKTSIIKPSNVETLVWAASKNDQTMITLLLEKEGSDINHQDNLGSTALIYLTSKQNSGAVKLLLANRADTDQKGYESGPTALTTAALNGNLAITKLLLANKASVNKKARGCYTPLMFAAGHGHLEVVELLLKNTTDADRRDDSDDMAL